MTQKRPTGLRGFTLVELMITMVVMVIVASAIGVVLIDNQRGWSNMYGRINSDVTTDGYVARKKFDAAVRNSSSEKISVDPAGTWIELYYYASGASTVVDRYVRFYEADGDLNIEYGTLNPKVTLSVATVCSNVSACTFKQAGRSAQMILTLDNGTQTNTVVTSAVTQN